MNVSHLTWEWMRRYRIVRDHDSTVISPTCVKLSPDVTLALMQGKLVATLIRKLCRVNGLPALSNIEIDGFQDNIMANWQRIVLELSKFKMKMPSSVVSSIIDGNCLDLANLLSQIYNVTEAIVPDPSPIYQPLYIPTRTNASGILTGNSLPNINPRSVKSEKAPSKKKKIHTKKLSSTNVIATPVSAPIIIAPRKQSFLPNISGNSPTQKSNRIIGIFSRFLSSCFGIRLHNCTKYLHEHFDSVSASYIQLFSTENTDKIELYIRELTAVAPKIRRLFIEDDSCLHIALRLIEPILLMPNSSTTKHAIDLLLLLLKALSSQTSLVKVTSDWIFNSSTGLSSILHCFETQGSKNIKFARSIAKVLFLCLNDPDKNSSPFFRQLFCISIVRELPSRFLFYRTLLQILKAQDGTMLLSIVELGVIDEILKTCFDVAHQQKQAILLIIDIWKMIPHLCSEPEADDSLLNSILRILASFFRRPAYEISYAFIVKCMLSVLSLSDERSLTVTFKNIVFILFENYENEEFIAEFFTKFCTILLEMENLDVTLLMWPLLRQIEVHGYSYNDLKLLEVLSLHPQVTFTTAMATVELLSTVSLEDEKFSLLAYPILSTVIHKLVASEEFAPTIIEFLCEFVNGCGNIAENTKLQVNMLNFLLDLEIVEVTIAVRNLADGSDKEHLLALFQNTDSSLEKSHSSPKSIISNSLSSPVIDDISFAPEELPPSILNAKSSYVEPDSLLSSPGFSSPSPIISQRRKSQSNIQEISNASLNYSKIQPVLKESKIPQSPSLETTKKFENPNSHSLKSSKIPRSPNSRNSFSFESVKSTDNKHKKSILTNSSSFGNTPKIFLSKKSSVLSPKFSFREVCERGLPPEAAPFISRLKPYLIRIFKFYCGKISKTLVSSNLKSSMSSPLNLALAELIKMFCDLNVIPHFLSKSETATAYRVFSSEAGGYLGVDSYIFLIWALGMEVMHDKEDPPTHFCAYLRDNSVSLELKRLWIKRSSVAKPPPSQTSVKKKKAIKVLDPKQSHNKISKTISKEQQEEEANRQELMKRKLEAYKENKRIEAEKERQEKRDKDAITRANARRIEREREEERKRKKEKLREYHSMQAEKRRLEIEQKRKAELKRKEEDARRFNRNLIREQKARVQKFREQKKALETAKMLKLEEEKRLKEEQEKEKFKVDEYTRKQLQKFKESKRLEKEKLDAEKLDRELEITLERKKNVANWLQKQVLK